MPLVTPAENIENATPPGAPTDKPPRRRGRPPGSKNKPKAKEATDKEIIDALSELLTAPAIPLSMTGHSWPANHVAATGPELARQIVNFGAVSPWWKEKLQALARGENVLGYIVATQGLVLAGATYLIPLLAYFRAVPQGVGEKFAGAPIPVPPRPEMGFSESATSATGTETQAA